MATQKQWEAGQRLEAEQMHKVGLPLTDNTPAPGLILYANERHTRLEMLLLDGRAIDLLSVYRAAYDCIKKEWHGGDDPRQFVGEGKRLVPLAEALKGRRVA